MSYTALAHMYERLNADAPYEKWIAYLDAVIRHFMPQNPGLVLDLACGTGRITRGLAALGYDMIGVDASEDMLAQAWAEQTDPPILYLHQRMESFELYGTVGAVVCCLDSLNYLLKPGDLETCFSLVHNYLDPNGVFLFDMNTPYQFETGYGNRDYFLESRGEKGLPQLYCGWRNQYDPKTGLCDFSLDLFEEEGKGLFRHTREVQTERCYAWEEIRDTLQRTGFELLDVYRSLDRRKWHGEEDVPRWFVVARCKKSQSEQA
ncbi:MAG: class I SAM-dependent methyltransferase [Clostridia bacterium]|nr:class I SAM-dependent methyltransferase [Clostridia bacterium]